MPFLGHFPHPSEGDLNHLITRCYQWVTVACKDVSHAENIASTKGINAGFCVEFEAHTAGQTIVEAARNGIFRERPAIILDHNGYLWTEVEIEAEHPFAKGEMGEQWELDVVELATDIVGCAEASLLIVELDP